jgi:hypothetical protein
VDERIHRRGVKDALLVFGICGIAGVLIDVDHIIMCVEPAADGRFMHPVIGLAAFIIGLLWIYDWMEMVRWNQKQRTAR